MTKSPDLIRRENGVSWSSIWNEIGQEDLKQPRSKPKLVRGLLKHEVIAAAEFNAGPLAGWLTDAVICQAVLNVAQALQTDIEDFVPTTQHERRHAPPP